LIYKEYNQVEIAHRYDNGNVKRNIIVDISSLDKYYGYKEIHVSIGRFKSLKQYVIDNDNSIAGITYSDVPIFYDNVVIDIDNCEIKDVLNFVDHLESKYNIPAMNVGIFFSGNKGFHILIPGGYFALQPSPILHHKIRYLAETLTDGIVEIDTQIYTKSSTIRMVNTIHGKSGLYKIPIYISELTDWNSIRKIAKRQRFERTFNSNVNSSMELTDLANKANNYSQKRASAGKINIVNNNTGAPFQKMCIKQMLHGGNVDDRGGRKNIAFRLAVHFSNLGYPTEVIMGLMNGWNERNNPPLSPKIIENVVRSAINNEYSFGCNDDIMRLNCDNNCYLFKDNVKIGDLYDY